MSDIPSHHSRTPAPAPAHVQNRSKEGVINSVRQLAKLISAVSSYTQTWKYVGRYRATNLYSKGMHQTRLTWPDHSPIRWPSPYPSLSIMSGLETRTIPSCPPPSFAHYFLSSIIPSQHLTPHPRVRNTYVLLRFFNKNEVNTHLVLLPGCLLAGQSVISGAVLTKSYSINQRLWYACVYTQLILILIPNLTPYQQTPVKLSKPD